jgi:biopolymer transport protein ExbB
MTNVMSFLHQGGWVMWPLLILFVITIGIILERAVTFRKIVSVNPEDLLDEIKESYATEDGAKKAMAVAEEVKTPFGRIFLRGLKNASRPADTIDLAMSQEAGNEIPILENYLPGLKTIVGIAPLLGLLGTIAGMIISFKEVAAHGLSSPTAVMSGVSEALVSTATGIGIAIIALIFYNYYASLVKKVIEDIEYYGGELTNFITGRVS